MRSRSMWLLIDPPPPPPPPPELPLSSFGVGGDSAQAEAGCWDRDLLPLGVDCPRLSGRDGDLLGPRGSGGVAEGLYLPLRPRGVDGAVARDLDFMLAPGSPFWSPKVRQGGRPNRAPSTRGTKLGRALLYLVGFPSAAASLPRSQLTTRFRGKKVVPTDSNRLLVWASALHCTRRDGSVGQR